LYLRLLAGLTSFRSKRCLSQVCSIGPVGHFPSSITITPLFQYSNNNGKWDSGITQKQTQCGQGADLADSRLHSVVVPAHGLKKALDTMRQVQEQSDHGSYIDKCCKSILKCRDHHAEYVRDHHAMGIGHQVFECCCLWIGHLEGKMQQMISNKCKQEYTGPDHVFTGKGGLLGRFDSILLGA